MVPIAKGETASPSEFVRDLRAALNSYSKSFNAFSGVAAERHGRQLQAVTGMTVTLAIAMGLTAVVVVGGLVLPKVGSATVYEFETVGGAMVVRMQDGELTNCAVVGDVYGDSAGVSSDLECSEFAQRWGDHWRDDE